MALYRTISLSFWTDTKIADEFTPEDRYFYLYLFTNPHTNLAGCYEVSTRQMVNETGYSEETVMKLLCRFSEIHKVAFYSKATKEILLVNWHKYNWTSSEKYRKPLKTEIDNVKEANFKNYLTKLFNGENVRYGIDTICIDTSNTNTNTVTINTINLLDTKTVSVLDSPNVLKDNNTNSNIYNTKSLDLVPNGIPGGIPGGIPKTNQNEKAPKNESYSDRIKEILDYLNQKTGKHYTTRSKASIKMIQERLKEGYSVDDFKAVIKNKANAWLNTDFQVYLRPETLFCAKHFDSYLNDVENEATKALNEERRINERQRAGYTDETSKFFG